MTPRRAAAAAVVSAVVLRLPTKEYTHRYSMMHRRLTTAGIEVAPHYDQLLVKSINHDTSSYDTLYQVDNSSSDVMIYWTMTGTHVAPDRQ